MKTNHNHLHKTASAKSNQNRFALFSHFNHKRNNPQTASAKSNQNHFALRPGFTIAELSLAMGFISVLLITIAILIVHITGTFQKGLSIKSVDTMGQSLSDNLSRTIAASQGSTFEKAKKTYYNQWQSSNAIKINNTSGREKDTAEKVPTHGEFCTGNYTYIWNTGYVLDENKNIYKPNRGDDLPRATVTHGSKTYENFRLLRVSGTYCAADDNEKTQYDIPSTSAAPVELLASSESALAIYDFQIFSAAYDSNTQHAYVSGSFILGTVNGGIDITSNTNFCTDIPDGITTDFNYCAINKFSFGSRTGIGKKDSADLNK